MGAGLPILPGLAGADFLVLPPAIDMLLSPIQVGEMKLPLTDTFLLTDA